jgi:ATP synthase protein I
MTATRFFPVVQWILAGQLVAVVLAGALVALFAGASAGVSALLGGLIALLSNLYFSLKFGVRDDRRTARQVVSSFYGAEFIKLVMTAGLFVAVYQFPAIRGLPLLGGYIVALTVFWFALLVRGSKL